MRDDAVLMSAAKAARFVARYGYAVAASAYLYSLGLRKPRHRKLIRDIAMHFGYRDSVRGSMPTVDLVDLVPETLAIELREPMGIDGNVNLLELVALARLVRHHRPSRIFEIGTFDGRTTLNLAANAGDDAEVFTLDLPRATVDRVGRPIEAGDRAFIEKPESGRRFRGTDCEPRIRQLYGDSARFDPAPFANSVDFVFVDGSHSYEYVIGDTHLACRMLSPGGVIVWHDYGVWDGVTRALDELDRSGEDFSGMVRIRETSLVVLASPPRA
jgi:predicted O-methyltransferase YrrM